MSECKIEFDETTGAVTVGPGELPRQAFAEFDKKLIQSITFTGPVTAPKDCGKLFEGMSGLLDINGLDNLDTSQVESMSYMFSSCSSLPSLDISNFDTSSVRSMFNMFSSCHQLASLSVFGWETLLVTDMSRMFCRCSSLESVNLSSFNIVKYATNMSEMFHDCPAGKMWEPILESGGLSVLKDTIKSLPSVAPPIKAALAAVVDIAPMQAAPVQAR